jgi:DNA-binding response OmpR family regulator
VPFCRDSLLYAFVQGHLGCLTMARVVHTGAAVTDCDVENGDAVNQEDAPAHGTVVVIDDEKSVVNLVRAILEMDDYLVYEALTGPIGLGIVEAVDPDVVLLDVMMPFMDGIEVCRRLKMSRPGLPVVILTARDDPDLERRCYEAGADHFMTKPLLAGQLTDVVGSLQTGQR